MGADISLAWLATSLLCSAVALAVVLWLCCGSIAASESQSLSVLGCGCPQLRLEPNAEVRFLLSCYGQPLTLLSIGCCIVPADAAA